jgi:simple sugar transport system permease protein
LNDLLSRIFSPATLNETLRTATPVALAAIGGAMTEHAGIMNIGMDGMILMGAFFGAYGSFLMGSGWLGLLLAVAIGILVGLLFALFVVKLKADEFIIGCALNTFAIGLTGFLSDSVFGHKGGKGMAALPKIYIDLPNVLSFLGKGLQGLSILFYLTLLLVLALWLFVYRTPYGFYLRAAGEKPDTLRTAGIRPERMKWIASILCGITCAVAGVYLSLGDLEGNFAKNMSNSRGYVAFACVIFASANPAKAYLAALMFGFFGALGTCLQSYISPDLTAAIPYVITILMMVYVVVRSQNKKKSLRLRKEKAL